MMTPRADLLANAIVAVGGPHKRCGECGTNAYALARLVDEILDQLTDDIDQVMEDDVTTGAKLLDEAGSLVNGPRQDSYGEPVDCMRRWADMLRAAFDWDVDAHKAALAMSLLKHVREAYEPDFGNRVDAVGYLEIADRSANVRSIRPVE